MTQGRRKPFEPEHGYASHLAKKRGAFRARIHHELQKLTEKSEFDYAGADMRWTAQGFYKDIVLKHKLVLDGWPANVIFTNPSGIRGGIHVFDDLLNRMEKGVLKFRAISNGEAAKLDAVNAAPGPIPPPILRPGRCDIGKHRYRPITNPYNLPRRRVGMGPRSPPFVLDADLEDEGVSEVEEYPETVGLQCNGRRSMDLDDIEEFSV